MLILKNLFRRKIRTTLSVLGVAIGIAAIIAFNAVAGGFKDGLNAYASQTGAHLMVLARDVPASEYSRVSAEELRAISTMPGVHQGAGTAFYVARASGLPALFLFGRDPNELPIRRYRNSDLQGRLLETDGEIMLGYVAAEKMKKKLGEDVELFDGRKFRLVGVYTVGIPWENVGAVVTVRVIQEKLRMGDAVQLGMVYLKDPRERDAVKARIERTYPNLIAVPSEEFAGNFENLQYIDWFVWVVSLIAVIVGGLGVLNTMLMTVSERTREIGTLRAVGWSCLRVMGLILSEGVLISVIGGATGLLVGWGGAEILIRWAPRGFLRTTYSPQMFLEAMAIALALGIVGALYPSYRASRLSPIEALKYE